MNNTTLAVALPDSAPKLTKSQIIKATAMAMDEKNRVEFEHSKHRREVAWQKLKARATRIARKRLPVANVSVQEGWKQQKYTVEFTVEIPAFDLKDEVAAYNAAPLATRVTAKEYESHLRDVAAAGEEDKITALLADPKIRKRFLELGEKLTTATPSAKPAITV